MRAGVDAFAEGGNAVDAALATAVALAVTYPHMVSPGGDAFILVHHPDGRVTALNGSGAAPRAADAGVLRRRFGVMTHRRPEAATVPGVMAAWESLHACGARLPWARALEPAVRLAAGGVPVARDLAETLAADDGRWAADPGMADVFFPAGRLLREGETLRQPALAATLRTVAAKGAGAFYRGEIGERFCAGFGARGGLLEPGDLVAHETEVTAPLRLEALGHEFLTAAPNSQGFVLLEVLAALHRLGDWIDPLGAEAGTLARLFAHSVADRRCRLGDPRAGVAAIDDLYAPGRAEELTAALRDAASHADGGPVPGDVVPRPDGAPLPGDAVSHPDGDTVALVAADDEGYAVAVIQSLFDGFGSGVLEPATGIICHDRGAGFSLEPGSVNLLRPGVRPAHSLMPLLVRRGGRLRVIAGTMGGWAQPQIHTQVLSRLLGRHESAARALAVPRWTVDVDYTGDPALSVWHEGRVPHAARAALARSGLPLVAGDEVDDLAGHAQYILIDADGSMDAASDLRADGRAVVITR
ncbi:MAG TPA: gamma-glutamyltransferase [Thermoleophilia bacterium]|nr:gamma-glutamyltransferase [Thermoleophilia bacterium]